MAALSPSWTFIPPGATGPLQMRTTNAMFPKADAQRTMVASSDAADCLDVGFAGWLQRVAATR